MELRGNGNTIMLLLSEYYSVCNGLGLGDLKIDIENNKIISKYTLVTGQTNQSSTVALPKQNDVLYESIDSQIRYINDNILNACRLGSSEGRKIRIVPTKPLLMLNS